MSPIGLRTAAVLDGGGLVGSAGVDLRQPTTEPPAWRTAFPGAEVDRGYRRLDPLSRAAVLVTAAAGIPTDLDRDATAIVLATVYGCLAADRRYAGGLARGEREPAVFPYTLPSTCLGEVALRHGLRGPSVCVSVAPGGEGEALREARARIAGGEASSALVLWGDALPPPIAAEIGIKTRLAMAACVLAQGQADARLPSLDALLADDAPLLSLAAALRGCG